MEMTAAARAKILAYLLDDRKELRRQRYREFLRGATGFDARHLYPSGAVAARKVHPRVAELWAERA